MTNSHSQSAHLEYSRYKYRLLDVSVVSISICSFCDCQTKRPNLLLCDRFSFCFQIVFSHWFFVNYNYLLLSSFRSFIYNQCPHSFTQTVCASAMYWSYTCVSIFGLFSTQSCIFFIIFQSLFFQKRPNGKWGHLEMWLVFEPEWEQFVGTAHNVENAASTLYLMLALENERDDIVIRFAVCKWRHICPHFPIGCLFISIYLRFHSIGHCVSFCIKFLCKFTHTTECT